MHIIGNSAKTFEFVEALSGSHLHIQVKKKKKGLQACKDV